MKLIFESQLNKIGNLLIWIVKKFKDLKGCVKNFFGGFLFILSMYLFRSLIKYVCHLTYILFERLWILWFSLHTYFYDYYNK